MAWLSARKLAGRVHRRNPEPLTTDPASPMPPSPDRDVRAVIDEELLALPERFRAVAVLCLVEGRTNTEAAGLLGIPKGTVDSRLSTAKAKLRERLLRRGVAAAAVLTAEHLLTSETTAAATRAAALAANAITVALDYAAGVPTAGTEHLLHTANGVKPVTTNLKWLAVLTFSTVLIGGGGIGVYVASAGEKDTPAETKKPDEKKPDPKPADKPDELVSAKRGTTKTADEVNEALKAKVEWGTLTDVKLGEFLELVSAKTGVTVRVDTAAFVRRGLGAEQASIILLDHKLIGSGKPPAMFGDLLREALARAANPEMPDLRLSYRIKGSEILIVPEYQPPTVPAPGRVTTGKGWWCR